LPIFASDNVTNEADIPGLVYHLPLKLAPDKWAEYIIDHIYDNTRHNTSEVLGMYGYDIKQESKKLENFYIQTTI
jgi:hypothetical protein